MSSYVSIEIGGTKLQAARGSSLGIIDRIESDWVAPAGNAQEILHKIAILVAKVSVGYDIGGVGVGYGGPVDRHTGRIVCSHQVPGWEGQNLKKWIQSEFNLPAVVENDANVAALGEATCGVGAPFQRVFYVTLGSGIGGGFIINKSLYQGASPTEAEIGHLRMDKNGSTLESRCSGWAVDRKVRQAADQFPDTKLAQSVREKQQKAGKVGGEAALLVQFMQSGDPQASSIWNNLCDDLSFGLSHVVHLLNPDAIILGGGLSLSGDILATAVSSGLRKYVMEAISPLPKVIIASLGQNVVPVGGLILAGQSCSPPSLSLSETD